MAIPKMQMTMDQLKDLTKKISDTDKSLLGVMNTIVHQAELVKKASANFNDTLAKVNSRTLGDYEAQKKKLKEINKINKDFQKSEMEILNNIKNLQAVGSKESRKQIIEQRLELKNLQKEHEKMFNTQRRAYEEIAKQNLKIIKDFEDGIEEINQNLDSAFKDGNLFKQISSIGSELQEVIETAMDGGIAGMEKILSSSLGGITKVFQIRALKLAEQGKKDLARITELKKRGAKSGGSSDDDKELTTLESSRVSSEKDATGMLAMSKGMQMLSVGVMGVVTAFKMMIDAESKVKEFNKDMLNDAGGSLSFLKHSQEGLASSLNTYREGFAKMANTVGMKADEIKSQFIALQDTTFFNKETLKDFDGFERAFKTLSTYSKGLGLSISETTEIAESFVDSMAIDTSTQDGMETLSSAFQSIGFFASKSNISTKAFTNQLKEANAKSTSFNKSIVQTASVMFKVNKALGANRAKDFFEGFEDQKEKEYADLIKNLAMAGGPASETMQKIMRQNAITSAGGLQKAISSDEEKKAFEKASKESGLNLDLTKSNEEIMTQLQGVDLTSDAFVKFISTLEDSGIGNASALIEKVQAGVRSAQGVGKDKGFEEQSLALRELSMGGQYAMKFAEAKAIIETGAGKGKTISQLDEKVLETVKTALKGQGKTEKEINTLISLDQRARGDFSKAQEIQAKYASASAEDKQKMDEDLAKMGLMMNAQGELVTKNTQQLVKSTEDMYVATGEIFSEEQKAREPKVKSEQDLMKDQIDATWGMGDRLEATFGVYLEQLNTYVAKILSYISSWFGTQTNQEMKTQQRLQEEKIDQQKRYDKQIKEETDKIAQLKKTGGSADEVAKSEKRIAELSKLKESSQSELELLQKGATLLGNKKQQELQLATTKRDVASKAFGAGTAGAKLGALKESLGKSTDQEVLDLLDEMRDIYENKDEKDATEEELKKLADFEEKVKASGLQLQLDSTLGTEYAKIFDDQGRALFESIEGYMSDTNKVNTDVLHKELLSSQNNQKEISGFFEEIGAKTQEDALKILESYRSDILEQENDPYFNKLTKEQEEQKKKIEDAMKKHGIQTNFESDYLTSNLSLSKGDEKFLRTSHGEGQYVSDTMKDVFNPALFAKAQTEENKKNRKETVDTTAEGIQQGLEKHELSKTQFDASGNPIPALPMQDFIWREKGGLQSFSPQDNVIGFKDQGKMGSAINSMMAGNTTNNNNNARAMFNININGGNKDEVLKTITDALKRAGVVTERTSYA